jgi:DNA-binding YbaB/EbfC family protein
MKNFGNLMKQAQEMQAKMAEMQESLVDMEVTGQSGGGMVTAVLNGKGEMRSLKIDKSLVDPEDVEVMEDLIVAAVNDAKGKVESQVQAKTQELMGGLQLPPGMKLPF